MTGGERTTGAVTAPSVPFQTADGSDSVAQAECSHCRAFGAAAAPQAAQARGRRAIEGLKRRDESKVRGTNTRTRRRGNRACSAWPAVWWSMIKNTHHSELH